MTDPKKTEAVETPKDPSGETELSDQDLDAVAGGISASVSTGKATCGTPGASPCAGTGFPDTSNTASGAVG